MQKLKLVLAILFLNLTLFSQTTISHTLQSAPVDLTDSHKELIQQKFKEFKVFTLDKSLLRNISSTNSVLDLNIQLPGFSAMVELVKTQMFSDKYLGIDHKINSNSYTPKEIFYKGYRKNSSDIVRLAIDEDFFQGVIYENGTPYYIEPVARLIGEPLDNVYVIYEPTAVISNAIMECAYEGAKGQFNFNTHGVARLATSSGGTTCRLLEIAQAYDQGMLNRYNSNSNLSTWNAAIWNVVDGLYDNEFSVDIDFIIIAEAFAPNFATSTAIGTYLQNFQAWGNGGGFGVAFDIGNLWTTLDLQSGGNTGVIGSVMDIPGVCQNDRYQIFEDFVGPTSVPPTGGALTTLAILIAHEVGHNLGMFHNDGPGPNIMEPQLNPNASSFTDASIHYFESILISAPCYSSCECIEVVNATPINCSADGLTHDLEVVVEHDNTGSFTLSAGGTTSSFAYANSPQTVTLSGVATSVSSINATDNNNGTCNFTVGLDLPDDPNISSIANTFCNTDNMNINLTAATEEEYGSIIIRLNGDDFSTSEQSAQIIDRNGNVVVDYPFGTFANNNTVVVNSGPLLLDPIFTPYEVVVADWFGDGFGSNQCQNTNGGPGSYIIEDGQGNIIRAQAGLQASTVVGCNGNDAVAEITSATPAVDNVVSGNWSGPGVNNGAADDGQGVFNPSTAGVGTHNLDYIFETYKGCVAERIIVTVTNCSTVCPNIITLSSSVGSDECDNGSGVMINYNTFTDGGINGVDYEIIWRVDGVIQATTANTLDLVLSPVDGCTPLPTPIVTTQVRCLSDNSTPNPPFSNQTPSSTIYPTPVQGVDFSVVNNACTVSVTDLCGSLIITNDQGTGSSFTINQGDPNQLVNFTIRSSAAAPASCETNVSLTASCPCPICPSIIDVTSNLNNDECIDNLPPDVTYTANVDTGVNGVDYEIIWRINQVVQPTTSDVFVFNVPAGDGCTPVSTPSISARILCICRGLELGGQVFGPTGFTLYPTPVAGVDYEIIDNDCTVEIVDLCGGLVINNNQSGGSSHTIASQSNSTNVNFTIASDVNAPVSCVVSESLTAICPCPVFLNLTGPINNVQDYEASDFIESDQVLSNPGRVDYDAANLITLTSGFVANLGVNFAAFIDGCNMGAGGFNLESEAEEDIDDK